MEDIEQGDLGEEILRSLMASFAHCAKGREVAQ